MGVALAVEKSPQAFRTISEVAVDLVVGLIERYLAEEHLLFSRDEGLRRDLLDVLDTFVRAGWPRAQHLVYRLRDIF